MLNFLYCFDSNYNIPAFCSMFSLLECVDERVNIFIMHKDFRNDEKIPEVVKNHKMLKKLVVSQVNLDNFDFPNINGTHISEATYYRLFLEDYLNDEIDYVTYLDCDVFCVNNPVDLINKTIEAMNVMNATISVSSEPSLTEHGKNLNMKSNEYFNAGVMVIDYKKWKMNNLKNKFIEILLKFNDKLLYWDQDILNIAFDGEYTELHWHLNYKIDMEQNILSTEIERKAINDISLLHFNGKFKPWALRGIVNENAEYFQSVFRKIYNKKYYLSYNYKINVVKDFLKSLKNKTFFKTLYPISLFFIMLKSLISK